MKKYHLSHSLPHYYVSGFLFCLFSRIFVSFIAIFCTFLW